MNPKNTYRFPFAKYPAVRLALLFSAGIVLEKYLQLPPWIWLIILFTAVIVYGIGERSAASHMRQDMYILTITGYLAVVIVFGGLRYSISHATPDHSRDVFSVYVWEELTFHGEIYRIREAAGGRQQIDLAIDTTDFGNDNRWHKTYNLRAVLDSSAVEAPARPGVGDRLVFRATVYPLEPKRNPHEFDYKKYLASENIYVRTGIREILSHEHSGGSGWNRIRRYVLSAIDTNFSPSVRPLAKALLIGYKNDLNRHEKLAFSRAGLSHIMAVSGLHVGFILAPFWLVIPFFWTFRYGEQAGLILMVALLFFYAGLTGFSASVTRASLVGGFLVYGRLFHKVRDSKNLTALAAVIILLVDPAALFSIGFQLSFSAVYIILLTAPVINRILPPRIRFSWYGMPVMVVIISVLVQVGLYPLLIYYFGEFSLIGPLANALVVPFLTIAIPFALFLLPFSSVAPAVTRLLNRPVLEFLKYLNNLVERAAGLEWSWIQSHLDGPVPFLIWISALFVIATVTIPRLRWKYISLFLFVLCLHQGQAVLDKLSPPTLKITVFDVGQGDAVLISTPGNRHFLIDTGRWSPGYNSAGHVILPHLEADGITRLQAVFHSHPHADHIGGTPELIEQFPIDTIYTSGVSYDSNLYRTYRRRASQYNIPVRSLSAGDLVYLDPSVTILVYGPDNNGPASNVNNSSLVLELVYGETEFLFMGDAEYNQEKKLINQYRDFLDTDFLKAGHHGSRTSSHPELITETTPEISVVSVALNNRFRHPNPEAVLRLRKNDTKLYFTSLEGALLFESDGTAIRKKEWR